MKTLIKIILIFFVFTVEIRVKAGIVYREPKSCDKKENIECLLFTNKIGSKVKVDQVVFYLGHDTLLYRDFSKSWHLIRGTLRVNAKESFVLNTITGQFQADKAEFVIQQNENVSNLFVVHGQVKPLLKSPATSPFYLTEGYWNWFGLINTLGFNDQGVPKPLTWKRYSNMVGFENWYLIIKDKPTIKDNEYINVDNAANFYLDLVQSMEQIRHDRQVADENRQRALEAEKNEIRRLFRKKFEIESLDE